ncbi:hypothetical protein GMOD_00004160 [Pyrenophora seminiperda CCB06]|uniref:Uncharacterized protein n=1 Tax=Pyrenophora seminiperda CCB06 TaxID=1302712 RepID=A0A3M7M0S1_9PLEO|nr:hypothetical protein GMOD_00004160 [Pyrenophora seminiperda CCB06]
MMVATSPMSELPRSPSLGRLGYRYDMPYGAAQTERNEAVFNDDSNAKSDGDESGEEPHREIQTCSGCDNVESQATQRVWTCPRCLVQMSKKFSIMRHMKDACWKICDECCSSRKTECNAILRKGPCTHCANEGKICHKRTGPLTDYVAQMVTIPFTQDYNVSPKVKHFSGKRKAIEQPEVSPESMHETKRPAATVMAEENNPIHLQRHSSSKVTLEASQPTQEKKLNYKPCIEGYEALQPNRVGPPPHNKRFAKAYLQESKPMPPCVPQTQRLPSNLGAAQQPTSNFSASNAYRLYSHHVHGLASCRRRVPGTQTYEINCSEASLDEFSNGTQSTTFPSSPPGLRVPSRQASPESIRSRRTTTCNLPSLQLSGLETISNALAKGFVVREIPMDVQGPLFPSTDPYSPVMRFKMNNNTRDVNNEPIYSVLTMRASERFGPYLDSYCSHYGFAYGVDWDIVYMYTPASASEEKKRYYIKIKYDMTPGDVYNKEYPEYRLQDTDMLFVVKSKKSRKLVDTQTGGGFDMKTPLSAACSIGSQVSEYVVEVEDLETNIYHDTVPSTEWQCDVRSKMDELYGQIKNLNAVIRRQRMEAVQQEQTILKLTKANNEHVYNGLVHNGSTDFALSGASMEPMWVGNLTPDQSDSIQHTSLSVPVAPFQPTASSPHQLSSFPKEDKVTEDALKLLTGGKGSGPELQYMTFAEYLKAYGEGPLSARALSFLESLEKKEREEMEKEAEAGGDVEEEGVWETETETESSEEGEGESESEESEGKGEEE